MAAEFKISRIKYTWEGNWAAATVYNPDNVVSVGGKVYACLVRHTAAVDFYDDLNFYNGDTPPALVPRWEKIADGTAFRGNWATSNVYFIGDIIRFGNVLYICLEGHTSVGAAQSFANDVSAGYWSTFFSGNDWKNVWAVNFFYRIGDIVKFSGKTYLCIQAHTSAASPTPGLLNDLAKWEEFVDGIRWRGDWSTGTVYNLNDLVRYGAIVYRCNTQHTSDPIASLGLEADQGYWDIEHEGIEYRGNWATGNTYRLHDVVKYGAVLYLCTESHYVDIGNNFDTDKFEIYIPGNQFEGEWNAVDTYEIGDVVRYGGFLFAAEAVNTNSCPSYNDAIINTNWSLVLTGSNIRGDWLITSAYAVGDIVRRNGQLYIAKRNLASGSDVDIIGDGSSINSDDWDLYIPGEKWAGLWSDDITFVIGDLVAFRGASFKCIQKHISDVANRPDVGIGVYWTQYTYGDPDNVLTDVGDIKYYATSSTDNLAIGNSGQALAVQSSLPTWKNFNASNAVYHVSLDGIDDSTRGTTLNSSWRTIRYALDNITGPATLLIKSGTYDEILPLRVPANVAVVGDELRGTTVQPANGAFTATDLDRFENIFTFLAGHLEKVVQQITVEKIGRVKQVYSMGLLGSALDITNINAALTTVISIINTGAVPSMSGSNTLTPNDAATLISLNRNFLQSEAVAFLRGSYPAYEFNESVVKSSVDKVLQAIITDLKYTGNYEIVRAGEYFYNGYSYARNKIQNMFLLRDGTGLRNMTFVGLSGTLGSYNQYLTKRPTAGAYASLDPGWGNTHEAVWVGNRSPYVQNVTTFGTACVGLKVDGALHNGGNKTIVSNDFTQILSDGIGVWCNADGGSECVSVFTYYNHIGYLCTEGGKIRGTNGNCSYGEYGAVAEGFNTGESPITGTVNNRYYDATVAETFTDSSRILKVFYSNAGQNYTQVSFSVTGAGVHAALTGDEFRDGGVHQLRLANLDGSTQPFGANYTLSVNNAQSGDPYTITLAASSDQTQAYYKGLRIVIPSGTGAGQFARIAGYDNTTKICYVADERQSAWNATVSAAGTNELTISLGNDYGAVATYVTAGQRVLFTGTVFGGITTNTIYVISSVGSGVITLEDTLAVPVTLSNATGSMEMQILGWNHFQAGTAIESVLNTTTLYSIEPRVSFSIPQYIDYAENLSGIGDWSSITYGNGKFVAVSDGNGSGATAVTVSNDGSSWTSALLPTNAMWSSVAYGSSQYIAVTRDGAGAAAWSTNGTLWNAMSMPALKYSSIAYGDGAWIAVSKDGNKIARSVNGTTWAQITLPESGDWSSVAYGKGIFIAVAESDSSNTQTVYSTDAGLTWTSGSIAGGCVSLTYGNNRFVAIEGGYGAAFKSFISFDGITWQEGSLLAAADWRSVTYGQGQFRAIANYESYVATSDDGLFWYLDNLPSADNYRTIGFGNPGNLGMFVAPISGASTAIRIKSNCQAQARIVLEDRAVSRVMIFEPGSGYTTAPTINIFDPNNSSEATVIVRSANGVLASPSIENAGEGYTTISTRTTITGDGFIDQYQTGRELIIDGAQRIPSPGDNLRINGIDDYVYKVISATVLSGTFGNYRIRLVIAKQLGENESPEHGTSIIIRQKYSQVRLTGHDFLDIGLGNFQQSNYPNTLFPNGTVASPQNEVRESNGGRVFYTSTDQDGNFRCGELFAVEQSTGTVTISADFFELEGLEELSIGGISVGGSGVVIREFSTDQLFTADSNNIIPTQRAIKAYLTRRISGGGSDAFTATFTAGIVRVGPALISTTTLERLEFPGVIRFNRSYGGTLLAAQYFVSNNPMDDDLV